MTDDETLRHYDYDYGDYGPGWYLGGVFLGNDAE